MGAVPLSVIELCCKLLCHVPAGIEGQNWVECGGDFTLIPKFDPSSFFNRCRMVKSPRNKGL